MKNILLSIIFIITVNCSLNKAVYHHGVHNLEKKQLKLIVTQSNKNDIIKILGPPSTTSKFNNDILIFIERKKETQSLIKFGRKVFVTNNVLVLEVNTRGLLVKKDLYNLNDMKKIKFIKGKTEVDYQKNTFVYDFLSSMRQKINDPLGKRKKK